MVPVGSLITAPLKASDSGEARPATPAPGATPIFNGTGWARVIA